MKRLVAAMLIFAGLGFAACAQRPGSHGRSAGRASASSHARFNTSRSRRYLRAARYTRVRPSMARRAAHSTAAMRAARRRYSGGRPGDWPYRRPYVSTYAYGAPYMLPGLGYLPGSFDDSSYDNSGAPQTTAMNNYPQPPTQIKAAPAPLSYQRPAPSAHASTLPQDDGAVTLLFKDGRAPMQIHNYVLTRTTLFVQGSGHREIALDQLDMAATLKANHDAGIEFSLPVGPE